MAGRDPRRRLRGGLKAALAGGASRRRAGGLTILVYHRVGGGTPDERDLPATAFAAQLEVLSAHRVVSLDAALDELERGDDRPKVVLTFDDGFVDVHATAFPLLAERALPFTLYLATAYVGGLMHWDGSTAAAPGRALDWGQIRELVASGLCTVANHTHTHARPHALSPGELDRCTGEIGDRLGVAVRHFAYPWGVAVAAMEPALRARFRSAATARLDRAHPGDDFLRLPRVPVRGSDPLAFFSAKFTGRLLPERAYARIVTAAKRVGAHG